MKCIDCKFWSDLAAQGIGGQEIEALCLSDDSPKTREYTKGSDGCEHGEAGKPIDSLD